MVSRLTAQFADAAGNLTSDAATSEIVTGASIPADGYLDGSTYNSNVGKYVDYYYLPVVTGNTGDVTWNFESVNQTNDGYLYLFKDTVNSNPILSNDDWGNTSRSRIGKWIAVHARGRRPVHRRRVSLQ